MKSRPRAFTLIELLVVISIVALLVAILLPTLAKAKLSGEFIKCGANLRSCGHALFQYSTDNSGRFAPVYVGKNSADTVGYDTTSTSSVEDPNFPGVAAKGLIFWHYMTAYGIAGTASDSARVCPTTFNRIGISTTTVTFLNNFSYRYNAVLGGQIPGLQLPGAVQVNNSLGNPYWICRPDLVERVSRASQIQMIRDQLTYRETQRAYWNFTRFRYGSQSSDGHQISLDSEDVHFTVYSTSNLSNGQPKRIAQNNVVFVDGSVRGVNINIGRYNNNDLQSVWDNAGVDPDRAP